MKKKIPLDYAFPLLLVSLICGIVVFHCAGALWADWKLKVTVTSEGAHGTLTDRRGNPVVGAAIENSASSITRARTNASGQFRFTDYSGVDSVEIGEKKYEVGPSGLASSLLSYMTGVWYSTPRGVVVISYDRWSGYIVIALLFGMFAWLLESFISEWRQVEKKRPAWRVHPLLLAAATCLLMLSLAVVIHCVRAMAASNFLTVTNQSARFVDREGNGVSGVWIQGWADGSPGSLGETDMNGTLYFKSGDVSAVDGVEIQGQDYKFEERSIIGSYVAAAAGVYFSAPRSIVLLNRKAWNFVGYTLLIAQFALTGWLVWLVIRKLRTPLPVPAPKQSSGRRARRKRRRNHH